MGLATTVFTLTVQAMRRGIEVGWELAATTEVIESSCRQRSEWNNGVISIKPARKYTFSQLSSWVYM